MCPLSMTETRERCRSKKVGRTDFTPQSEITQGWSVVVMTKKKKKKRKEREK
jgi:hypothetical protein